MIPKRGNNCASGKEILHEDDLSYQSSRGGVMPRSLSRSEAMFMPLKLREVLQKAGITQREYGDAVHQSDLSPMSDSMVSLLLGRGVWPKKTPRSWIEQHSRNLLRERGSHHADDPDLFDLDEDKVAAQAPVGSSTRGQLVPAAEFANNHQESYLEPAMLNQKAKRHFGLVRDPFQNDVQTSADVFLAADQRYVREAIWQAMKRPGDLIAVIGESGGGKTILRRECLDRIQRENLPCVVILPRTLDKTVLTARGLCEAILGDLAPEQKPKRSMEALARQVEKVLIASARAGQTHVLMIEEAHDLTTAILKYLKRFWEIEDGFRKLLSIVLIGQPELKDKLNERKYPEVREFIRRCEQVELLPLDGVMGDYLKHKFQRVDVQLAEVMVSDAIDAIAKRLAEMRMGTYPLIVNNLVTRALNEAADLGAKLITPDIVRSC